MYVPSERSTIDLTLEITSGCRFSCTGCQVDRVNNALPTNTEYAELLACVDDFIAQGQEAVDLTVGPTDLMSMVGYDSVLTSVDFTTLARRFHRLIINIACLSPDRQEYVKLAQTIETVIPHGKLKLTIPVELRHLYNERYLDRLRERIQWIKSELPTVEVVQVYVALIFDTGSKDMALYTPELLFDAYQIKLHEPTHVDFVIPHARKGFDDLINAQHFRQSVQLLDELMAESGRIDKPGHQLAPALNDLQEKEGMVTDVVFRNGDLYHSIFLGEPITPFHPDFAVPKPWSVETIGEFHKLKQCAAINHAVVTSECMTCPHLHTCAENGVQNLMAVSGTYHCLLVKDKVA